MVVPATGPKTRSTTLTTGLAEQVHAVSERGWVQIEEPKLASGEPVEVDSYLESLSAFREIRKVDIGHIKPIFNGYQSTTRHRMTLHTDNTYSDDPCDLLILSCIKQAESGGETLIADSVDVLRGVPEGTLQSLSAPIWQWRMPGGSLSDSRSVLDDVGRVRWWREFLVTGSTEQESSADLFELALVSKSQSILLHDGDSLVIDNHRVLHGRSDFVGSRCLRRVHVWYA